MSITKLRLCVFTGREDTLLVHAGERGGKVILPPLTAPFSKGSVIAECRAAGVDVTVIETVPGRWSKGALEARNAERGATGNAQRQVDAVRAQVLRGSINPAERDRAKLITRLQEIPTEQRQVKSKIADATARASRGDGYMSREDFGQLRDREAALKEETIAIQAQLAKINNEIKTTRRARHDRYVERFMQVARKTLDEETFLKIADEAHDRDEDE